MSIYEFYCFPRRNGSFVPTIVVYRDRHLLWAIYSIVVLPQRGHS